MLFEVPPSRRHYPWAAKSSHLKGIVREREVHSRVQDLVLCGVRPKVIYQVIGKQMSLNEVKRIHDCINPLPPEQRHGRNIKFENVHKISAEANALYIECFGLVKHSLALGASRADALCSVWRIMVGMRGLPTLLDIGGCTCEEMIVLFLNFEVNDLTIQDCEVCRTRFLRSSGYRCMACESSPVRKRFEA
jgi:hypothetical protein